MNTFRVTGITSLVVLAVLASTIAPASEIYQWVDENGVQHFSQYRPADDTPNVSQRELEDSAPPGDGEVEDVYNVEEHEKRMAAWREERDKKREEARERNSKQQPKQYRQPERSYPGRYWYPPVYGRPPYRPPQKPTPPIEKPSPPSYVKPRGISR
ncbi:MAG TPA: DUF4124 domain-containing protein [Caldithrix sp.]|nr:DUF4124 domain-containing protein [Caldithrix sp.]